MLKPLLRILPTLSGDVTIGCMLENFEKIQENNQTIYNCEVNRARLVPLSDDTYKSFNMCHLNGSSYEYDLSSFYKNFQDTFFKANFNFNKNSHIIIDKTEYQPVRNTNYEWGVRRLNYFYNKFQYMFFAPVFIESTKDIPYSFNIMLRFTNPINKYSYERHLHVILKNEENLLYNYIKKYTDKLQSNVINLTPDLNGGVYFGIDLNKGGFTKKTDITAKRLFNIHNTIHNFDAVLMKGFERNNIAMQQILPLSFYFNIEDVLNPREKEEFKFYNIDIYGYYTKNNNYDRYPLYDFDFDYDGYTIPVRSFDTNKLEYRWNHSNDIVTDVNYPSLNEKYYIGYKDSNKSSIMYSKWRLKYSDDIHPYYINSSFAFSYLSTGGSKHTRYPEYTHLIQTPVHITYKRTSYNINIVLPDYNIEKTPILSSIHNEYFSLMNKFYTDWFSVMRNDPEDDGFYTTNDWGAVSEDGFCYYNGIMYNLNNIISKSNTGSKINKFGIFIKPKLAEYSNNKINSPELKTTTNILSISNNGVRLFNDYENIFSNKHIQSLYAINNIKQYTSFNNYLFKANTILNELKESSNVITKFEFNTSSLTDDNEGYRELTPLEILNKINGNYIKEETLKKEKFYIDTKNVYKGTQYISLNDFIDVIDDIVTTSNTFDKNSVILDKILDTSVNNNPVFDVINTELYFSKLTNKLLEENNNVYKILTGDPDTTLTINGANNYPLYKDIIKSSKLNLINFCKHILSESKTITKKEYDRNGNLSIKEVTVSDYLFKKSNFKDFIKDITVNGYVVLDVNHTVLKTYLEKLLSSEGNYDTKELLCNRLFIQNYSSTNKSDYVPLIIKINNSSLYKLSDTFNSESVVVSKTVLINIDEFYKYMFEYHDNLRTYKDWLFGHIIYNRYNTDNENIYENYLTSESITKYFDIFNWETYKYYTLDLQEVNNVFYNKLTKRIPEPPKELVSYKKYLFYKQYYSVQDHAGRLTCADRGLKFEHLAKFDTNLLPSKLTKTYFSKYSKSKFNIDDDTFISDEEYVENVLFNYWLDGNGKSYDYTEDGEVITVPNKYEWNIETWLEWHNKYNTYIIEELQEKCIDKNLVSLLQSLIVYFELCTLLYKYFYNNIFSELYKPAVTDSFKKYKYNPYLYSNNRVVGENCFSYVSYNDTSHVTDIKKSSSDDFIVYADIHNFDKKIFIPVTDDSEITTDINMSTEFIISSAKEQGTIKVNGVSQKYKVISEVENNPEHIPGIYLQTGTNNDGSPIYGQLYIRLYSVFDIYKQIIKITNFDFDLFWNKDYYIPHNAKQDVVNTQVTEKTFKEIFTRIDNSIEVDKIVSYWGVNDLLHNIYIVKRFINVSESVEYNPYKIQLSDYLLSLYRDHPDVIINNDNFIHTNIRANVSDDRLWNVVYNGEIIDTVEIYIHRNVIPVDKFFIDRIANVLHNKNSKESVKRYYDVMYYIKEDNFDSSYNTTEYKETNDLINLYSKVDDYFVPFFFDYTNKKREKEKIYRKYSIFNLDNIKDKQRETLLLPITDSRKEYLFTLYRYNQYDSNLFVQVPSEFVIQKNDFYYDSKLNKYYKIKEDIYDKLYLNDNGVSLRYFNINNDKYDYLNIKDFSNIHTVNHNGEVYMFYIIECEFDNTTKSFMFYNISDDDHIKMFTHINDYSLKSVDVQKYFKLLLPFMKYNIVTALDMINQNNIIIKPWNITYPILYYSANSYDDRYKTKYSSVKEKNILGFKGKTKYLSLSRYYGNIVPVIKETENIDTYNIKFKDVNEQLLITGNYQSVNDTVYNKRTENIYDFKPYNIYTYTQGKINEKVLTDIKNNPILYTPYEYKHYNDNHYIYLPVEFNITVLNNDKEELLTYEEVHKYEDDNNVLQLFKDYVVKRVNIYSNDNDAILFLYKKYNVYFDSVPVGSKVQNGKKIKVYTLSLLFKLK